ncbi:probable cell division control protein CDC12 [Rhynchosporium agropyri]|uniref:Probable cell division control protein CDC12 n=1 Tax=Rhynchosporium agropyri TaxID=914238 RepID=A0A1E1KV65_9HELO|nr:probable cell division control protein CDC12 [Rhynchosporium agropyri]
MRPLPGDDAYAGRSRSTSFDNDPTPLASRSQVPQMSYFIADEKTVEYSRSQSAQSPRKQKDVSNSSSYGVESLENTISSLTQESDDTDEKLRNARLKWKKNLAKRMSRRSEEDLSQPTSPSMGSFDDASGDVSPSLQHVSSQATISRPFTPLSYGSPAPPSLLSGPDSRRNSDAGSLMDEVASQAIVSSGDEDKDMGVEMQDSGSAPQLVMPSIKMPSRRPFTERGKNMGRLKVLIAGDSGVGKTSLIKAIVQTCEDIVHVDPLSATPISIPETRRRSSRTKSKRESENLQTTTHITEVYASTRSYPSWWSDLEESRVLRRRKSMGDSILERNLCFVDTPGFGNQTSCLECITPVIDYLESQYKKVMTLEDMGQAEMINLLSGNGGSQVDVVLYLISSKIKSVDIEYVRRLSALTNVIPLVARADTLSTLEVTSLKEVIVSELETANIRPFLFGLTPQAAQYTSQLSPPYAISTAPSRDQDTMDASLLMSPDYIQPLVPSELHTLVSRIFDQDSISWLRHSAAKKFVAWRASSTPIAKPQSLYQPLTSSVSGSQGLTGPVGATTSYALARITDHTQREERIAQVRLANWAAELQRSLHNERIRFEALARSERAVWLTERLGECVSDGTIVQISEARKDDPAYETGAVVKHGTYSRRRATRDNRGGVDKYDPLGLLMLNEELKRKGWVVLKVISSFGIISGLAYWVTRTLQGSESDTAMFGFGGMGIRDWLDLGAIDWR